MSKKANIMSLSMDVDIQEKLKVVAKKRNVSVSKLIRDLADKYINEEDNVDTVILKVPKDLRTQPEALRTWMSQRTDLVIKTLTSIKE
jgi:predicted DNA-binding ribbon-helix-helix protein